MKRKENIIENPTKRQLLNGQIYKAPIWKIVVKPSWTIPLRFSIAYLFSFFLNSIDLLEGIGFFLSLAIVETIYYNYFSDEKNRP